MEGTVIKSTGSWYDVRNAEGKIYKCRIKGRFRLEDIKHTNPIAVGDKVVFELENNVETGVIEKIEPRTNYIIRKASNLSKQTHIIASNLDQALLMVTIATPATSNGFIDRFLMTAEAYHISVVLVFNKIDLCVENVKIQLDETVKLYQNIGYKCLLTSAKNKIGIDEVKKELINKTTLICGHSGVGKSSLLNTIENTLNLTTKEVSKSTNKGQHTTTFAEMHQLNFGGYIVDTPGIREFGVVDFEKVEISHYFKEMQTLIGSCKFNNCIHLNEPDCAIIKAVENEKISAHRYKSYLSILNNEDAFE